MALKLSTRGQYALHAMIFLAKKQAKGPQSLKTIAEDGLPEQYLEQLLGTLRRAGLISSVRGAAGGYLIAKPLQEITVGQILESTEGPINLSDCVDGELSCSKGSDCETRMLWRYLTDNINDLMQGIKLSDIIEKKPYQNRGVQA